MVDALSAPVAILDEAGRVIGSNGSWQAAAARPEPSLTRCGPGDSYFDVCEAAANHVLGATLVRGGLRRVLAGRQRTFQRDCRLMQEGVRRDYRVRLVRLDQQTQARVLVECEDMTEAALAREMIHDIRERVLEAQDDERQRLAVELHDSVGQNLVSLGLGLSRLRIVAPKGAAVATIIAEMVSSLEQAHAEIRSLSYLLNPSWREHEGTFENAVREFAEGFGRRAGLSMRVRLAGGACSIDGARELALFRVMQEALVNIHRHARAKAVVVELLNGAAAVMLRVTDDGQGFQYLGGAASPTGVGISGMRARVREFGGELNIVSGPAGTTLTVKLPSGGRSVGAHSAEPGRLAEEARSWNRGGSRD